MRDYDELLENVSWRVMPTIVMKDGAPFVLTCKDHGGGSICFTCIVQDGLQIQALVFQINYVML
eukprot:4033660-Ditylum_brightwellii.AAC.1